MNSRTAQTADYERTRWVLSKGQGDEEKAAGLSSLLITTFGSSETQVVRSVQVRGQRPGRPVPSGKFELVTYWWKLPTRQV